MVAFLLRDQGNSFEKTQSCREVLDFPLLSYEPLALSICTELPSCTPLSSDFSLTVENYVTSVYAGPPLLRLVLAWCLVAELISVLFRQYSRSF